MHGENMKLLGEKSVPFARCQSQTFHSLVCGRTRFRGYGLATNRLSCALNSESLQKTLKI